jgi:hypothetical protein
MQGNVLVWTIMLTFLACVAPEPAAAQDVWEYIMEDRTPTGGASVTTRKCIGGADAGTKCKNDTECSSGLCFAYNILDLTINFALPGGGAGWALNATQQADFEARIQAASDALFDATDGQMLFGTVSLIYDNGAPNAAIQFYPDTCTVGGNACYDNSDCTAGAGDLCQQQGTCTVGGNGCFNNGVCTAGGNDVCSIPRSNAQTGKWGDGGDIEYYIDCMVNRPYCVVHELIHLIGNARDEYEGELPNNVDDDGDGQTDECRDRNSTHRCYGGTNDGDPCTPGALNPCPGGGVCDDIICNAADVCIMDSTAFGRELCTDANHDPDLDTEQSRCRNGHSCWTQLGISWPSVIEVPANLPDPGPAAAPVNVSFLTPSIVDRFVAVIDRSDSMDLETPNRIDVAVTAAQDFLSLLSDNAEFGIASFASSDGGDPGGVDATKDFPAEAGLRTIASQGDRDDGRDAAEDLRGRVGGYTNIAEGLRRGLQMMQEAGGAITLNSSLLLLTDGLNNRPSGGAEAELDAALTELSAAGLPVFVSCIGEARDSTQCSVIADRTAGRFVDSDSTDALYDAFIDFLAEAEQQGFSSSVIGQPIGPMDEFDVPALVEYGVDSVRFVVNWSDPSSNLDVLLFAPNGSAIPLAERGTLRQGQYYRVDYPAPGSWTVRVSGATLSGSDTFSVRSIVDHQATTVRAGLAKSTVTWPEGFLLSATPRQGHGIIGCAAEALVELPDGTTDHIFLYDNGRGGDTAGDDGGYSAAYRNLTAGDGIYTFTVKVRCDELVARYNVRGGDSQLLPTAPVETFERVIRFSGIAHGVPDNLPPVAEVCSDVTAECQGSMTMVALDGNCSSDPEHSPLTYQWSSPTGFFDDETSAEPLGSFPVQNNLVELVVTDSAGASSELDQARVIIRDTTPPIIACPPSVTAECRGAHSALVDPGDAMATDLCSSVSLSDPGESSYPLGTTDVTYLATDGHGNSASCSTSVTVVDTTPPTIACNARDISPPEAPVSFTATADDQCGLVTATNITGYECWKLNGSGRVIRRDNSCRVSAAGPTLSIRNSGGVGSRIDWTVQAVDDQGNVREQPCSVVVQNPARP